MYTIVPTHTHEENQGSQASRVEEGIFY